MFSKSVVIANETGLHARPATLFIETAKRFQSAIRVVKGDREADGQSILSLMILAVSKGSEIVVQAEGKDEVEAVNTLVELIERRFDETSS